MMLLFPILRKFMDTIKIFYTCFAMSIVGYIIIIVLSLSGTSNVTWNSDFKFDITLIEQRGEPKWS